jgi:protein-S-isoprenylcysteine O-methyltransferase Ste14
LKSIGKILFKYRSYTPIPFVVLIILFADPNIYSLIIGFSLSLSGEIIRIWAVSFAGSETRTTNGVGGTQLVTQGPYSILRNPLYIGNIIIYTGFGIMSYSIFPYLQIFGLLFFIFQYYTIILNEEEYLQTKFNENFHLYKKYVNRFFPSFKKIPEEINSNLEFDLKEGIKSERRSIQAFLIISVFILLIFIFQIKIK